jgi:hypothetical protein
MTALDRVSANCLRGEPPPDDLRRLWKANRTKPWDDIVPFELVEELDDSFFAGYREKDGVPPEAVAVFNKMFGHIAFIGRREDGELVGYWLGPENRHPSKSPIVELDTEGQFELVGRNLAEYLLARTFSDVHYDQLRSVLANVGLKVKAKTQTDLFESFNDLDGEFGNPNRVCSRYEKGLGAPPPPKLRFGHYKFPAAQKILHEIGILKITANSKRAEVMKLLGKPKETGRGIHDAVLGYLPPWIKYYRDDCQLHISFNDDATIVQVVVMEPDWEPGM